MEKRKNVIAWLLSVNSLSTYLFSFFFCCSFFLAPIFSQMLHMSNFYVCVFYFEVHYILRLIIIIFRSIVIFFRLVMPQVGSFLTFFMSRYPLKGCQYISYQLLEISLLSHKLLTSFPKLLKYLFSSQINYHLNVLDRKNTQKFNNS